MKRFSKYVSNWGELWHFTSSRKYREWLTASAVADQVVDLRPFAKLVGITLVVTDWDAADFALALQE